MSKTATLVGGPIRSMRGDANLYRLSEPLQGNYFVVVSAVNDERFGSYPIVETYIFGADSNGKVTDWGELFGSYKGGTDHAEALRGAGYEIAS